MKATLVPWVLLSLVAAVGVGSWPARASDSSLPVPWPAPPKVRSETIPFPLDFAPQLPYHGVEEVRFAPGFSHPDAPDYFTYAFAWYLEASRVPNPQDYRSTLTAYFGGLMDDVGVELGRRPGRTTTARVTGDAHSFNATVWTWDAFFTDGPLTLRMTMHELQSPVAGHRLFYVEASPHPDDKDVRHVLSSVRAALPLAAVHG